MAEDALCCANCLKSVNLVRHLECGHEFCEPCCKTNCQKTRCPIRGVLIERIVCPLDQQATNMPHGYEKSLRNLPKKILLNLSCENCCKISSIQNHWWCDECNETVCSFCAMKHHRDHNCDIFECEKLIAECATFIKPFTNTNTDVDYETEIEKFCLSLSEELKNRFALLNEASNFIAAVNNVCNVVANPASDTASANSPKTTTACSKNTDSNNGPNFRKKFNLAFAVLSKFNTKVLYDVEKLKALIQAKMPANEFPSVESVADLFFECTLPNNFDNAIDSGSGGGGGGGSSSSSSGGLAATIDTPQTTKNSDINCTLSTSLNTASLSMPAIITESPISKPDSEYAQKNESKCSTHNGVVKENVSSYTSVTQKLPVEQQKQQNDTAVEKLTWNLFITVKFKEPSNLCAIPNLGVIVSDKNGIHMLDEKLNYIKYKGWAAPSSPNILIHTPAIVYHSALGSLFILREDNHNKHDDAKKIIELSVPGLTRKRALNYPAFSDTDRRLLAILTNGHLLCASSTAIWKANPSDAKVKFELVRFRSLNCNFEKFLDMVVGPRADDAAHDSLYIMSVRNVYIFAITTSEAQVLHVISTCYSSIICIQDAVYALNKDLKVLVLLSSGRQKRNIPIQQLPGTSEIAILSSIGSKVYLLNHKSNSIYIGSVVSQK